LDVDDRLDVVLILIGDVRVEERQVRRHARVAQVNGGGGASPARRDTAHDQLFHDANPPRSADAHELWLGTIPSCRPAIETAGWYSGTHCGSPVCDDRSMALHKATAWKPSSAV